MPLRVAGVGGMKLEQWLLSDCHNRDIGPGNTQGGSRNTPVWYTLGKTERKYSLERLKWHHRDGSGVKARVATPDDINLIPETYMVEGEKKWLPKVVLWFYIQTVVHTKVHACTHTGTHKINNYRKGFKGLNPWQQRQKKKKRLLCILRFRWEKTSQLSMGSWTQHWDRYT